MNIRRPLRHSVEAGNATVEAGVTISVLLLLILGIAQFGQTFWAYNTILLAVAEAGRYAMVHNQSPPDNCGAQSQAPRCPTLSNTQLANCTAALALQVLAAYQVPKIEVSVREDRTSFPATITICASYSVDYVAPQFLPIGPFNLTRQIMVPLI
jgi:Flp pilus assembly protein TadG